MPSDPFCMYFRHPFYLHTTETWPGNTNRSKQCSHSRNTHIILMWPYSRLSCTEPNHYIEFISFSYMLLCCGIICFLWMINLNNNAISLTRMWMWTIYDINLTKLDTYLRIYDLPSWINDRQWTRLCQANAYNTGQSAQW